jgi:hypothetical protein
MADILSILSSNYKTTSGAIPSRTKYVSVDPKSYEGTWSGVYANKSKFVLTISQVHGFRAKVKYQSGTTVRYQDIMIKDKSFKFGDTKFTLTKAGVAKIKTVVTNPATGGTTLESANALLS